MIWYPDTVHLYRQNPGECSWVYAIKRLVNGSEKLGQKAGKRAA
jgi:hypothetical protein